MTLTTLRAGLALNIISSPVNGLMPLRAFRAGLRTTRIFISPGTVNVPGPRRPRSFLIRLAMTSNTSATSRRVTSVFSSIPPMLCCFVLAFFPLGLVGVVVGGILSVGVGAVWVGVSGSCNVFKPIGDGAWRELGLFGDLADVL